MAPPAAQHKQRGNGEISGGQGEGEEITYMKAQLDVFKLVLCFKFRLIKVCRFHSSLTLCLLSGFHDLVFLL